MRIQITFNYPHNPVLDHWDPVKLDRIITNLIANAIKFGASKPIDIKLFQKDTHIVLQVRDYGIGVKQEDRERIFQRYERAAPSNQYGGIGLGLWLAAEAARAMQGSLTVDKPPEGEGSVFTLSLPHAA